MPSALAAAVRLGLAPDPTARPTAAAWAASLRSACAPAPVRLVRRVAAPGERVPPAGASTRPQTTAPSPPAAAAPRSSAPQTPLPSHPPARHRRGHHRLLARALAAALLAAAAVVVGTALSRVDRASTASPVPRAPVSTPLVDPRPVDWRAVLAGLDTRRTEAFATGESLALARVYAPGSLSLARDTDALRRLVAAGVTVPRLRLEVSEVGVVSAQPARAVLRVVDRLPAHDLVARDGSVREHRPGRGRQAWRITLVAADAEWRISAVEPAAD
ncbi:MAG TPA: hypothetical protein VKP64_02230 [Mycobacteriales bacterium]|nr:hypothetical protein [Mycobacteriales bacterium]